MFLWEDYAATGMYRHPGFPQLPVGSETALSPLTGLHHQASSQLAPPTMHLYITGLTPFTGLHCHMCVHGETLQPQKCTNTARDPAAASTPITDPSSTAGPGLHHFVCVCKQSLTLQRHLQLPLTAEYMHTTSSCHHHCLSLSLAPHPKDATEHPNSP